MSAVDWSSFTYAYFFVGTACIYGIWRAFHHTMVTVVKQELQPICNDIQKIKHQVFNNGGESLKDAIDRIERDAIELKINQAIIKTKLEA